MKVTQRSCWMWALLACVGMIGVSTNAWAQEDLASMQVEMQKMQTQMSQMQKKMDVARKEMLETSMKEILAEAQAQPALPKWMENLTFSGDFRLRFQTETQRNRDIGQNRNRMRYRLRFGFKKTWWDNQMEVGFRLASGNEAANSANETFGNEFEKKDVWLDQMYAKYRPTWLEGLTVTAGKFKNPIRSKTSMSWDGDINPEGFYVDYTLTSLGDFKPYVAVGYWIFGEGRAANSDVSWWTFEGGFNWKLAENVNWFVGGTWYAFEDNWENVAAGFSDSGFSAIELTSTLKWKMAFMPEKLQKWSVTGSWFHNCKDDRVALDGEQDAFSVKLGMGQNKKKGDFSVSYEYRYVGMNSVPNSGDGWGDSDFGTGLTNFSNTKGHVIQVRYSIDDFLTVGGKVYATDVIRGAGDSRCLGQVDVVWKF